MGSSAWGYTENRHKYQGNELTKQTGLNLMDFNARQYDPQLGRFLSIDPRADEGGQESLSPYAAMGNAPESMIDPNGDMFHPTPGFSQGGMSFASSFSSFGSSFGNGDGMGNTIMQNMLALRDGSGKPDIKWDLGRAPISLELQMVLNNVAMEWGIDLSGVFGTSALICNFADEPVASSSDPTDGDGNRPPGKGPVCKCP